MKILHVTFGLPPYASGGLPLYVSELIKWQKRLGDEPIVLEPGEIARKMKIVRKRGGEHDLYRLHGALPVSYNFGIGDPEAYMRMGNKQVFEDFLRGVCPDIIHVHSIMGIHKEFFEVAKSLGIKMVMTTHDYFGLDLRANFTDNNGNVYFDRDPKLTALRNVSSGVSELKQTIIQSDLYKNIKNLSFLGKIRKKQRRSFSEVEMPSNVHQEVIDKYERLLDYYMMILGYIDYFLFNSSIAKDIYDKFLPNARGQIIYPTTSNMANCRPKLHSLRNNSRFRVVYIGRNEKYKGVDILAEAVSGNNEIECLLYGDDFSDFASENVHNMDKFSRDELGQIIDFADLLVMSSRCYETFALPVMEALSRGLPAAVSSCVGAKDMLMKSPVNVIFEPDVESLKKCLTNIMEEKNYDKLSRWVFDKKFNKVAEENLEKVKAVYEEVLGNG